MQQQPPTLSSQRQERPLAVLTARLATALVQAIGLYALTLGYDSPESWQAVYPQRFTSLFLVFVYTPLVAMVGLGQMRNRALVMWACLAAIVIAALGYHEIGREGLVEHATPTSMGPRFRLLLAIASALFAAHVLVLDGTAGQRLLPPYERHFNTAWKLGLQIALSALFVGVFWLLLTLGGRLFMLSGLTGFRDTIEHAWFALPASTLALACAIHLTDVQPALIRGARAIVLSLLSWLLPVLTAIVAAFLLTLSFTSLEPLWRTGVAASLLIATMAALVFLINCSYQDGGPERATARVQQLAARGAAILLAPLCGLAVRALYLRITQYGWTEDRVFGAAAIFIAACYATGYAVAAIRSPRSLRQIEVTNVATAYLAITAMLALFSPIADPARLMVVSQIERLRTGAVAADAFDFKSLKYDGARWGIAALEKLARQQDGPDAETRRGEAERALASPSRYALPETGAITRDILARHIERLASGRTLPAEFHDPAFWIRERILLQCLNDPGNPCRASYIPMSPGEPDAILFADTSQGMVFEQDAGGRWRRTGELHGPASCPRSRLRKGMQKGKIELAPHPGQDIVADGVRFTVLPYTGKCPDTSTGQ